MLTVAQTLGQKHLPSAWVGQLLVVRGRKRCYTSAVDFYNLQQQTFAADVLRTMLPDRHTSRIALSLYLLNNSTQVHVSWEPPQLPLRLHPKAPVSPDHANCRFTDMQLTLKVLCRTCLCHDPFNVAAIFCFRLHCWRRT
jgi:hypothetical protein